MKTVRSVLLLLLTGAFGAFGQSPAPSPAPSDTIAEVSADRGPCSVQFHVTDLSGKPIYNATIQTTVRWGLGHKIELQTATNAGGLARFVKLPAESKKPLQFAVSYRDQTVTYSIDPATACQAERDVPLRVAETK
jgi:hypothetical protein